MDSMTPRVYRATAEAWIGKLILPLAFFLLLTVTAVRAAGLSPWVGGIGIAALVLVGVFKHLLPMLRDWLYLDERSLEGNQSGRYFHIYWTEVVAAWMEDQNQPLMCIGTREGTLIVPLRFYNRRVIWERVQKMVPASALEQSAVQRLPDYREWEAARKQALHEAVQEDARPRPVADHWMIQMMGWCGLTFFLLGAFRAMANQDYSSTAFCLVLAGLCMVALLNWGITEFGPRGIERSTLFGDRMLLWENMRWIELDPTGMVMVVGTDDGQMVIPGPGLWNGSDRKAALTVLLAQTEKQSIPLRRTVLALFRISRRSRARK